MSIPRERDGECRDEYSLPLFLLRRSLMAARISLLSSKSFDSSSCSRKNTQSRTFVSRGLRDKAAWRHVTGRQPNVPNNSFVCFLKSGFSGPYHSVEELFILDGGQLALGQFSGLFRGFGLSAGGAGAVGDGGGPEGPADGRPRGEQRLRSHARLRLHLHTNAHGRRSHLQPSGHERKQASPVEAVLLLLSAP